MYYIKPSPRHIETFNRAEYEKERPRQDHINQLSTVFLMSYINVDQKADSAVLSSVTLGSACS